MSQDRKTVLVTGASAGIGKSTAAYLLERGYTVYCAARRVEKMQDLAESGGKVIAMDVTVEDSMTDGVAQIESEAGAIDVLVNNAGYGSYGAVEDVPLDEARRQFEVNVFGLARLSQLVLPKMREQRYGKIVNVTSIGGKCHTPLAGWYHATKFAVEGLSDCMRFETKPFGIDVIVVEPGGIKTEWGDVAMDTLQKTSADTVYADLATKISKMVKDAYEKNRASDPIVIARVIHKAITARNPKTRYAAGYMAKSSLFLRRWLSDKMWDRAMRMILR